MSFEDFITIFPSLFTINDNTVTLNDGTEKIIEQYKDVIKRQSGITPEGTSLNILCASYYAYQSLCKNLEYKQTFKI
jgi:hypothetical protein